jgi:hypothetical protein
MSGFLSVWFRDLLRPTIKQVHVVLLENGKPVDVGKYDAFRLQSIVDSITLLWKVPDKSSFWFETEAYDEGRCFQKRNTRLYVVCYKEDMISNKFKSKMAIPLKYRKKMFDTVHTIHPEKVAPLSVMFKLNV